MEVRKKVEKVKYELVFSVPVQDKTAASEISPVDRLLRAFVAREEGV